MAGGGFQLEGVNKMGKMSHIAYLCEHNKRDELIEEVSDCAEFLGKTAEEIADGFIDAHNNMRSQKENPAFKVLNEIADTMLDDEKKVYENSHICKHGSTLTSNCFDCEREELEDSYRKRKTITMNDIIKTIGNRGEN